MHFTVLLLAVGAHALPTDDRRLEFVTFVHRHGDRSPVSTYPSDPYGNESLWNNGWGELTTAGKRNSYALGKWLRSRYASFLPRIYNKRDFEVLSTDVSRTLMSAYLLLAGLYEPTDTDVWNPDIKWQPIPVHTTPSEMDNVLAAGKPCPRHSKLMLQLMLSKEFTTVLQPYTELLSEVVRNAGYSDTNLLSNFLQATMVFDSLNVQNQNGLSIPEWSRPYFPHPLQNLSSLMLRLSTFNGPLQRLSCGLLVKEILNNFRAKSLGVLEKKMWEYSAHDITIVGLRQCLGFQETDAPPYASALILELSSRGGKYYVNVLYKTEGELRSLTLPGCTEFCPLDKFEELVDPVIPDDWEAECQI